VLNAVLLYSLFAAGRAGRAVTFVTQYDIELYQRIEHLLGRKLDAYPANEEAAVMLATRVAEAQRMAAMDLRDAEDGGDGDAGGGRRRHRRAGMGPADGEEDGGDNDVASALVAEAESGKRRRAMGKGVLDKAKGLKLARR
jgi:ATP-dependent RNA helicase DDX47/RRP3